jgi:hypothetical protein
MSGTTEGRETAPQSFRVVRLCQYRGTIIKAGEIVTPETDADRLDIKMALWFGEMVATADKPEPPAVNPEPPAVEPTPEVQQSEPSPVAPMTTNEAPTRAPVRPPPQRPRGRR